MSDITSSYHYYWKAEVKRERQQKVPWWKPQGSWKWFLYYAALGTIFLGFGMHIETVSWWLRMLWFALSAWDLWYAVVIADTLWEPGR
jgi:hypothetical protein